MERLLDELIGCMRAIKVARIDVVRARGNGLAQNSDRTRNVAWWPPDQLVVISTSKLHCAKAHSVYGD